MAFIKKNYKDISDAKNRGDKRAIAIFKALCDGCPQDQLDDMVEAFLMPVPEQVSAVMPSSSYSQFGAGNPTSQPQAMQPQMGTVMPSELPQKNTEDINARYYKGTVFHGDADEYAPGYAPEGLSKEDMDSSAFDSAYDSDIHGDDEVEEETNYYDTNTIDKISSLLQDKNLSQNDISTLLKEMRTRK